jgi:hypothetical protein
MRTLSMSIVTRRILRQRITIKKFEYLGEFSNKIEIASNPYSMAKLALIYAKKRRRKSHAWAPLSFRF